MCGAESSFAPLTQLTGLQEYKQRLVKAKKYIQNLKQQAADATAAREQALSNLQAVQQQLEEKRSTAESPDVEGDNSVPRAEYEQLQVSRVPELCMDFLKWMRASLQIYMLR